jgi:hypothetical protein
MSSLRKLVYQAFKHLAGREMSALEADCKNPLAAQLRKLNEIVSRNADTAYGKEHGFSRIKSLSDFRQAVAVSDYEAHRPYIDRIWNGERGVLTAEQPFMFATTSGTMARPKYIPVTDSYIREFRHASVASGFFTLQNFPGIADGVTLSVFSPAREGASPGGIPYGAISGGLYLREPWLVKKVISPIPYQVYLSRDYESKYYAILRCALVLPVTCVYTLNPSTIVVLLKRLDRYGEALIRDIAAGSFSPPAPPDDALLEAVKPYLRSDPERARFLSALLERGEFRPDKIWPQLQVVCCWTRASAAFYIKDFPDYFGEIPVTDITYGASEGRGTVSMGDGRQLLSIRSHLFEFIPEEEIDRGHPTVLLAHELEEGRNYYIIFTTSSGLYRYHINDVVKVVGRHQQCPLIEFQYKGGNISSFTGEKLTELQITDAMRASLQAVGVRCRFFTVLPEFRPNPHYRLLFEAEPGSACGPEKLSALAGAFEAELCAINIEYAAKRQSLRLDPVSLQLLKSGAYETLRKQLTASGVADAQIKVSHLNPKEEIRSYFEKELDGEGAG